MYHDMAIYRYIVTSLIQVLFIDYTLYDRRNNKKVLELWWQGLPPGVRGKVWIRAIGNELNISKGMYILHRV